MQVFDKHFCVLQQSSAKSSFLFLGVRKIMVTGASVQCSKEALRLTRLYPGILYSSAGELSHCPSFNVSNL